MPFEVFLTQDAADDLSLLYEYIVRKDVYQANYVLDRIEEIMTSLSEHPVRGSYPKELLGLGIRDFREIYFKPYRIIYRVVDKRVYVLLIVDGRRDMQTLLERRLLR